ncbi:hypothetical protein MHYP_G00215540 [Metynnis hypsauchen]
MWKTYQKDTGHPSGERTLATLRQRCYWPRMTHDVKEWTATCPQCVLAKTCPECPEEINLPQLPKLCTPDPNLWQPRMNPNQPAGSV